MRNGKWLIVGLMPSLLLLGACAGIYSRGTVDLIDGTRLRAVEFESIGSGAVGTDVTLLTIWHCPSPADFAAYETALGNYEKAVLKKLVGADAPKRPSCVKAAEASGASAGFLKAIFNGAAAGAAIGAGLALQSDEYTDNSTTHLSNEQEQAQRSKAISKSVSKSSSRSSSYSKGGNATVKQPHKRRRH